MLPVASLPQRWSSPHRIVGRGQQGGLRRARELDRSYLRDTLAVLAAEKDGPGDAAGVLALEEERLGLAVLEAEDLAVATDVDLTLYSKRKSMSAVCAWFPVLCVCDGNALMSLLGHVFLR